MIDNCTAELYCAGQCFGNTMWNCGPDLFWVTALGIITLVAVWLVFREEL